MIDHELTDPTGSALTITHNDDGTWITATQDHDEVTVGPFPARALRASFDMGDDLADGGVTAAAIEAEVVSPERARSLVQERDEVVDALQTTLGRAIKAERELSEMTAHRDASRDIGMKWQVEVNRLRNAQPRPLTADDVLGDAAAIKRGMDALTDFVGAGNHVETSQIARQGAAMVVIRAALTEPTRPEGAEELARLIATADVGEWDCGDLADALLSTGRIRMTGVDS